METLVLIPGTLCNHRLFQGQVDFFRDRYNMVVADAATSSSLEDQAADILKSVEGDFVCMGLSYGGIISFEILRQAAERVKGLVIIDSTHKLPTAGTRRRFDDFMEITDAGGFRSITPDFLLEAMIHPNHLDNKELAESIVSMAYEVGESGFRNQVSAQLGRPDSTKTLTSVSCPTLILVGDEDRVCPPQLHEEMHRLVPNSQYEVISQSGHLSTMEQPKRLNTLIETWLDKI